MRCPSIAELPLPPVGKTGWPWTEETNGPGALGPRAVGVWPKISVVTPSYNQGKYIEETIRSVLLQGYPNLEYFVIDGGSSDETKFVLEKYAQWLTFVVSEPDQGQADALNKGFMRATGSICAYLNSDDVYLPAALLKVGLRMAQVGAPDVLTTSVEDVYPSGLVLDAAPTRVGDLAAWIEDSIWMHQPGVFWRRSAVDWHPWFPIEYRYVMDSALFMRLCENGASIDLAPEIVSARFRLHESSKTVAEGAHFHDEQVRLMRGHLARLPLWRCRSFRLKVSTVDIAETVSRFQQGMIGRWQALDTLAAVIRISPEQLCKRMFWGALRRVLFTFPQVSTNE